MIHGTTGSRYESQGEVFRAVLECGSPLPLCNGRHSGGNSGRGLPQSKTLARGASPREGRAQPFFETDRSSSEIHFGNHSRAACTSVLLLMITAETLRRRAIPVFFPRRLSVSAV